MSYDTDYMFLDEMTKDNLRAVVRSGHLGGHDSEWGNIVGLACDYGAEFLDEILTGIERHGANVESFVFEKDKENRSAADRYATRSERIAFVMAKHGVDLSGLKENACLLRKDELASLKVLSVTKKRARMLVPPRMDKAETAFATFSGFAEAIGSASVRRDGSALVFAHAKSVVELLGKWELDKEDIAAAWLLGILDVASDKADAMLIREEARYQSRKFHGLGALVVLDQLTWNPFADAAADKGLESFLWNVSKRKDETFRAVAVADNICLVREWLARESGRPLRARWRFDAARELFEGLDQIPERKYPGLLSAKIPAEIATVAEELAKAERDCKAERTESGMCNNVPELVVPPSARIRKNTGRTSSENN